jgi:two-component system NarL family sensor kinase
MSRRAARAERHYLDAQRGLALIRVAALPVVLAGERLIAHPELKGDPFDYAFGATVLYALAALLLSFRGDGPHPPRFLYAILDVIAISALAYTSGGAFSQIRYAFFVLPFGAAFLLPPRATLLASLVSVGAYLAVSLPHPATHSGEDVTFILIQALYLSWAGMAAVLLAVALTNRARRIEELAASRGRLVQEALGAEDRERKRLAEALHDEALQELLVAGQEIDEAERGDRAALIRAREGVRRAVAWLRAAIFDLHPYVVEHAGLEGALRSIVGELARRGGLRWRVVVDFELGERHDQLVVSLVRELATNVLKHARASELGVTLTRSPQGSLLLEVRDDGRGVEPGDLGAALSRGHIGLASCRERVEAVHGRFEVRDAPGGGTEVRIELPRPHRAPSPRPPSPD